MWSLPDTPQGRRKTRPDIAVVVVSLLVSLTALAQVNPPSPPPNFPAHVGGQWGPVLLWPHVSVSMANLPDGRILTYASNEQNTFPGSSQDEYTHAAVWDPETGEIKEVPHPSHDMFCAALVTLESGETLVMGGRNQGNSPWVSYYDFSNDQWIQFDTSSDMNRGRWYPTAVYMGSGDVFIAAGVGGGVNPERWAPGGNWTLLTGIDLSSTILELGPGRDGSGSWPLLQLDKSGKIFHHGATTTMNTLDPFGGPSALGTITDLGTHFASDGVAPDWFPDEGVSVLYDEGKILVAGGSTSSGNSTSVDLAFTIDINGPAPVMTAASDMNLPRQFQNEVMLPTGDVLVVGGNTSGLKFTDNFATLSAEAWDPDTDTWTLWNAQDQARAYHSTALLLLDGRVISAGGGLGNGACPGGVVPPLLPGDCEEDHWNAELFSPPYLFDTGGLATRPVILDSPNVLRVGRTFTVQATPGLSGFSMVRMSATTHTMNTDQRFLRPSVVETAPGRYDITLHSNQHVLVPGYWMLFAMDGDVPSIAKSIQIVNDGRPRGPPISGLRNDLGDSVLYQIEAEDPDGNPLTFIDLAGLPQGLSLDSATGIITGTVTQGGLVNVSILAFDGSEGVDISFQWVVSTERSESGTVAVSQVSSFQWHTVNLDHTYENPVVVMGPASFNDPDPTTVRVRNVTPTSFEFQLDEWLSQDGVHGQEEVSYLVVEAGEYLLPGGGALVAGIASGIDFPNPWTQPFTAGVFTQTPLVLAQVATDVGIPALAPRIEDVTTTEFVVRLQEEEFGNQVFPAEDVHWIALEPALIPSVLEGAITAAIIDEQPPADSIAYSQGFSGLPHLLANMQTVNEIDPAVVRRLNASTAGVDIFIEEDESVDTHTQDPNHANEVVGWLAIDPAVTTLGLLPFFNESPTVIQPENQVDLRDDVVSLFIQALDPEGGVVSFSAAGLPPGLSIDPNTGEIAGTLTTSGVYVPTVTVTDPSSDIGMVGFLWTVLVPLEALPFATPPATSNNLVDYTAVTTPPGSYEYDWDFGDGTPPVGVSGSPDVSHTFAAPGRYIVTLTVSDLATSQMDVHQFVQNITAPVTALPPTASTTIAYETASDRIWVVNPDNNTVTVIDALSNTKVSEIAVAADPRTLAVAGDGRVWVACKDAAVIDIINPTTLAVVQTVDLTDGSQPHGVVFNPTGTDAYVTLEASGEVLRLDGVTGIELASQDVGGYARNLAVSADGTTLWVTRFVTPLLPNEDSGVPLTEVGGNPVGGEVLSLAATTLAPGPTTILTVSTLPDSAQSARGVPNYLGAAAISPDGGHMLVPSKQDNILRGAFRDTQALTHDTTVRAITSRIELATGLEDAVARVDHDNASVAGATIFSKTGAYALTALEGNREVAVIDPFTHFELGRVDTGRAPHGLVLSPDGFTLYVDDFMDRSVSVYDLSSLLDFDDADLPLLAVVQKVALEALTSSVLNGKQLFYDAQDPRMALERYMACAACHNDGGQDGRVWDFTDLGEGFRNTIGLQGRGTGHGRVHWTANFDEVQDFEGQIRHFGGLGLMTNGDFAATSDPLGAPKAGLSDDLDDLAAYVGSLQTTGASPNRTPGGAFTPAALAGRGVFENEGCDSCHGGVAFTDSASGVKHDVGTLKITSGPQTELDTPTLRNLWFTAPYLHDGSAPTPLAAVLAHSGVSLTTADQASLAAYLTQIDDAEFAAPGGTPGGPLPVAAWGFNEGAGAVAGDATGHGHDGTISGAVWTPAGQFGSALVFDGNDDVVVVPDADALDLPTGALTLSAWVYPTQLSSKWASILQKQTDAYFLHASSRNSARPGAGATLGGACCTVVWAPSPLPVNTWSHVAVTYDGAQLTYYINGSAAASVGASGAIQATTTPLRIGNNTYNGEAFAGRIDEVRVYDIALDALGIQADMNTPVTPPVIDTTAPTVVLTAPAAGTVAGAVTVSANASDNVGVVGVQFLLDGVALGAEDTQAPYSLVWDTSQAANGAYVLSARARDAAGNTALAPNVAVTVNNVLDTTDPTVVLTAPAAGTVAGAVTVSANASDNVGVVGVQFLLDGVALGAEDLQAPYAVTWNTTLGADGAYLLSAQVRDAAGNTAFAPNVAVTVDNSAQTLPVAAWGFNEGAGAVAGDATGHGHDGAISGALWTPAGQFGSALVFDGSNDVVVVPDADALDLPTGQMTLSAWVYPTLVSSKWASILQKQTDAYFLHASSRNSARPGAGATLGGACCTVVWAPSPLPVNTWSHVAVTYDGAQLTYYINGSAAASVGASGAIQATTTPLRIGNNTYNGEAFAGRIDEVRVYDIALDALGIQADMSTPVGSP